MHAETVDILSKKGRFSIDQSVAVAEAIDVALREAQLVTVPILDARLAALNARWDSRFSEADGNFRSLESQFHALRAEFKALETQFKALEERFKALEDRFKVLESQFKGLEDKFISFANVMQARAEAFEAKLEKKSTRHLLVLLSAIFASYVAQSSLGSALLAVLGHLF